MVTTDVGIWAGALLTIAMYSFLYRENPFYRISENVLLGIGTAQVFLVAWESILRLGWRPLVGGNFYVVVAFLLGFMLYGQLHSKYRWVSRTPIAVLVGVGTGLAVRGMIESQFTRQLIAMTSVVAKDAATTANNIYMAILTTCVVIYFLFTLVPRGASGQATDLVRKVGRVALMGAFGAMVGNIAMGRWTLVIGRIMYLLYDWLGLPSV